MKIFIGLNNVASVFSDLRNGFADLGLDTMIVSRYKNTSVIIDDFSDYNTEDIKNKIPKFLPKILSYPLKKIWSWLVDFFIFHKAMRDCDIFIFISSSFKENFSDLRKLKSKGKKIVCVFVGDDVRWIPAMEQEFRMYQMAPIEYDLDELKSMKALEERLIRIRKSEKYADFIFSRLDQAQLQLRPYYRWNMMVYPPSIKYNPKQRIVPTIAHAPSDRSIKGTNYVLDAFEILKKEGYVFNISLIENVPNREALALYGEADIVIDQLLCPGTGKLATEALASGAVVLANMSYDVYPQKNPSDCPIVDVNPETIKEVLGGLISDYDRRVQLAQSSRAYVEKYLDIRIFCQKVVKLIQGESIPFDYEPDFFHHLYVPISRTEKEALNTWTLEVKEEQWYNKRISNSERDGLEF